VVLPSPRLGVHLQLGAGLRKGAARAEAIGARTVQVFADNPNAWARRRHPPAHLDEFRKRVTSLDVTPVAVHAAYLINLAGPERHFRELSIDVLAAEIRAAATFGAPIVNVHIGSHRDTTVEAGIERVADGVDRAIRAAGPAGREITVTLENSAGGGWTVGTDIPELEAIAEAAARRGISERRLAFCLDTAHAWGAGIAMDDPEAIDRWLSDFDAALGLERLALIHLNDSRSERGSRHDRHEHVGAGQIGERGLGHLVRHPNLAGVPFILETPGMDLGYDLINLDRARRLAAGEPLEPLPPEAFRLPGSRTRGAAPPPERATASADAADGRRTRRRRTTRAVDPS
jgi:deoxyribonuclease IV